MLMTFLLAASMASCLSAEAAVKLPLVISDHMVYQREMPVPIWGMLIPVKR